MINKAEEVQHKKLSLIIWHNFLGGIAWGLGITIGATFILAVGAFILSQIDYVPFFGSFVLNIVEFVQQNSPNL